MRQVSPGELRQIEAELVDPEAWKKYVSGLFKGGKAKKAFARWQSAEKKAVLPAFQLRTDEYDGTKYQLIAWPIAAEFDPNAAHQFAQSLPLNTVRYHTSTVATGLDLSGTEQAQQTEEISGPLATVGMTGRCIDNQKPYNIIIWAIKDGKEYYLPVVLP
jgi:hypothetical protein